MTSLRHIAASAALLGAVVAGCNAIFGTEFTFDPPAGGQGGEAGAQGGMGPCTDDDGDGVCADEDCDDDNAQNYPGNTEICGDFEDNNCDDDIDDPALCMGLGTFVSALTGDDSWSGIQTEPLRSIAAGVAQAELIGGGVDVYVAEGTYIEAVVLSQEVSLFGGHACSMASCDWARDPKATVSLLQATDVFGVRGQSGIARGTVLDGFRIVAFGGTPMSGGYAAAITLDGGSPTVRNNVILGAQLSGCTVPCEGTGILVRTPSDAAGPLIVGNDITAGVSSDTASGIAVIQSGVAEIAENVIGGGSGVVAYAVDVESGVEKSVIRDNELYAPACAGSNGQHGALRVGGNALVDGNVLNLDRNLVGDCDNGCLNNWCAGIHTAGGPLVITNNIALGGAGRMSAALVLRDDAFPYAQTIINGNTFDGGGLTSGMATSSAITLLETNQAAVVGRIRNNLLLGGSSPSTFGVYEADGNGVTVDFEVLDSNAFGNVGSAYRNYDGAAVILYATISDAQGALMNAMNNFTSDCTLDLSFHLGMGSACIDTGTSDEAPDHDIDGDARPLGSAVDVGADEAQ